MFPLYAVDNIVLLITVCLLEWLVPEGLDSSLRVSTAYPH